MREKMMLLPTYISCKDDFGIEIISFENHCFNTYLFLLIKSQQSFFSIGWL